MSGEVPVQCRKSALRMRRGWLLTTGAPEKVCVQASGLIRPSHACDLPLCMSMKIEVHDAGAWPFLVPQRPELVFAIGSSGSWMTMR
jgi:hypothetical protein